MVVGGRPPLAVDTTISHPVVSLLLHPSFTEMTEIDGNHMWLIQIVQRKITFSHWGTLQLLLQQTLVYPSRLFDTQPGQGWFCLKLQLGRGKIENCTKAIIIAKMDGVKRTMSSFAFLQCITKENPLVLEHSENSATFNKKNWKYDNKGCIGDAKMPICRYIKEKFK